MNGADMNENFVCKNIGVNEEGHLTFAGQDTVSLAKEYGTPLYLMDEDRIRENMRVYKKAFAENFPEGSEPLFASKACSFAQVYRIALEEGMGIDVVSSGEIYTAMKAGYPLSNAHFHGNNKTDEDIAFAIRNGIGFFVSDNREELDVIDREAQKAGIRQKVLLRLTPGIDTHTYEKINTGLVDSKFGTAIETGQAEEIVKYALTKENIELKGYHCHVGSQVFAEDVFEEAALIMIRFIGHMKDVCGYTAEYLDLGGGYGVRYVAGDGYINIAEKIRSVAETVAKASAEAGVPFPKILMEPGRSIVADAGMTLYTAGSVKRIPGYKNYVSIDGGMTDNPRFALYGSKYTCYNAGKMNEERTLNASLVGRCCESGDIIAEKIDFAQSTCRGDVMAVCTTGAYNYSMASNYNRVARPAMVMLKGGESYIAIRRETLDDLVNLDI